ncbi:hypothetical protein L596_011092 [Steinernema carpocapsae]|uniref:Uncharacterized protein n=1 Tax=Steinernema carpocapsae TaxID=34508 RepID=A0A4U5NTQ5_STECR|nr:hypothetical protein L596_011092 [Steinernema carpocapsae]
MPFSSDRSRSSTRVDFIKWDLSASEAFLPVSVLDSEKSGSDSRRYQFTSKKRASKGASKAQADCGGSATGLRAS